PTPAHHARLCSFAFLPPHATAPSVVFCPRHPGRASGGPPVLCGFPSVHFSEFPFVGDPRNQARLVQELPMIANALIVTIALLRGLGFWFMGDVNSLIPYRHVLLQQCGGILLLWFAVLFVNVFAAVDALQRKFFLKDTGRKLSHLDKQALAGQLASPSPTDP